MWDDEERECENIVCILHCASISNVQIFIFISICIMIMIIWNDKWICWWLLCLSFVRRIEQREEFLDSLVPKKICAYDRRSIENKKKWNSFKVNSNVIHFLIIYLTWNVQILSFFFLVTSYEIPTTLSHLKLNNCFSSWLALPTTNAWGGRSEMEIKNSR